MRALSSFIALATAALVAAQDGYGGYGGDYGGDYGGYGGDTPSSAAPSPMATSSTMPAAAAATTPTAAADASDATGKVCTDLMCITATVNATTTLYELEQKTSGTLGWMAIGFGQTMAGSPMVILWPNADGSVTLSQRHASAEVMPVVDAAPPRAAALSMADSSLAAGAGVLAFTVPTSSAGASTIDLIWAYGDANPGSSDPGAPLQQHLDSGPVTLAVASAAAGSTGTQVPQTATAARALLPYQKLVVAHAVLFVVAFMLLLPSGVLFARLLRTTSVNWFRAHWLLQGYSTGPVIAIAFLLGIVATGQQGSGHFNDRHKLLGLVLVLLYAAQVGFGAVVHFVKDPKRARRPAQNYAHAVLGLTILGLAAYQVRLGYATEWPMLVGLPLPKCINALWVAWIIGFAFVYAIGLAFVPAQYRLEAARRGSRF